MSSFSLLEGVFRGKPVQRILMDFTQGDEPVISVIQVAVTPERELQPPAIIPYTQESSEDSQYVQEDSLVVHSRCA